MKTFFMYIALVYVALAIQGMIFHGTKPDLVLILVCFFSVRHEQGRGMLFGALAGLLTDISSGFILGPNVFSKTMAAFLSRTIRENLFQWNIIISTFLIASLSIIDIAIVHVCYEAFSKMSFVNRSWGVSVATVAYTIAASLMLYPLFHPRKEKTMWY
ncbi:MAG: rod shape-determining protein MreD [Nitrospiraceae bacterium]|nr:MAG: rod shape-determining protein MreD [Nitrospiraceae bacterium]